MLIQTLGRFVDMPILIVESRPPSNLHLDGQGQENLGLMLGFRVVEARLPPPGSRRPLLAIVQSHLEHPLLSLALDHLLAMLTALQIQLSPSRPVKLRLELSSEHDEFNMGDTGLELAQICQHERRVTGVVPAPTASGPAMNVPA